MAWPQPLALFWDGVRERCPTATCKFDPPAHATGAWVLDVVLGSRHLYVVHLPGAYLIGLALVTEESGYESRPDEIFDTLDLAVQRAIVLLHGNT